MIIVLPHGPVQQFSGLAADGNNNGTVDAADYVVWRDTLNQSGIGLPADGNNNGTIDNDDYAVWAAHFGRAPSEGWSAGSGSVVFEPAGVPEPSGFALLACAIGSLALAGNRFCSARAKRLWPRPPLPVQ